MATTFRITTWCENGRAIEAAVDRAFREIARLNTLFSDYEPQSEISRLSRTHGTAFPVSEDMWQILIRARDIAERTDGAFDFTCGHLSHLWRRAIRLKKRPPEDRLRQALEVTNWKAVEFDEARRTVCLTREGMLLDLGGIAKGFAADAALRILNHASIPHALVTAGGDLACGNSPPGSDGWDVQLRTHEDAEPAPTIRIHDAGVSTSGDLHQFVEIDGIRYSHIVSPKTGTGLTNQVACTVIAPDTTVSDALATAYCVAGETEWDTWRKTFPNAQVRLSSRSDGGIQIRTTEGFPLAQG